MSSYYADYLQEVKQSGRVVENKISKYYYWLNVFSGTWLAFDPDRGIVETDREHATKLNQWGLEDIFSTLGWLVAVESNSEDPKTEDMFCPIVDVYDEHSERFKPHYIWRNTKGQFLKYREHYIDNNDFDIVLNDYEGSPLTLNDVVNHGYDPHDFVIYTEQPRPIIVSDEHKISLDQVRQDDESGIER